jgi:AcrR family transcriptional regulator
VSRRGWGGDPPADDAEARTRIVEAAIRSLDRDGLNRTGLAAVAKELGITRQTVYRQFASTEELFSAVAQFAADEYLDRLAAHLTDLPEPAGKVIEAIAYAVEELPKERYVGLLLVTGHADLFAEGVCSPIALEFGRSMLTRMGVDWEALGFEHDELNGLIEFALRMMLSLVLDPTTPQRSGRELRSFLRRWVAPALVRTAGSAPGR